MDCHDVVFSASKSEARIANAMKVFPKKLLMRLLAFTLHLLGARRQVVAQLVGMPEESVKTVIRTVTRDGFTALRDRRQSEAKQVLPSEPAKPSVSAYREGDYYVVEFGNAEASLRIPVAFLIQARTVLLSLLNAGLLSAREVAEVLDIHVTHCRELARKLGSNDVDEVLVDKRQGLKQEYLFTPEVKSELIQQFALNAVSGRSTSSRVIADDLEKRCSIALSPRSVRLHLGKLGLSRIADSLPELIALGKKTSSHS
jgi:hypothetical protein